ncbi:MAG: HEAT repeat domain-containing protein, partial [Myxococcales bacterium]|nr:HEAT repeat domain-containing protein [Myxococcales bacterium]
RALRTASRRACEAASGSGPLARPACEQVVVAARRWLATNPPVAARVSFALAVAGADGQPRRLAAATLAASLGEVKAFRDRWRATAAASLLAQPDPRVDAVLARWAHDAPEWMIRAAALDALAARGSAELPLAALRAADDPTPRVRAAAASALAEAPGDASRRALEALANDPWPLVRAAAVTSLASAAHRADGAARVVAAIDDPSARVRAAAIDALPARPAGDPQRCTAATPPPRAGEVWRHVAARMAMRGEAPEVLRAAIAFARRRCAADVLPALAGLAERPAQPGHPGDRAVAFEAQKALRQLPFGAPAAPPARSEEARP